MCSSSKTSQLPDASSVNDLTQNYVLFSSGLHMHLYGRRIWTEQYRQVNGVRTFIGYVGYDDFFDFNQQR